MESGRRARIQNSTRQRPQITGTELLSSSLKNAAANAPTNSAAAKPTLATGAGYQALENNTTGNVNTATGRWALNSNTTSVGNTANGFDALADNTTGSNNIALGDNAGFSLTTGDNNIDIGNQGVTAEANTIRIGTQGTQTATFVAGIRNVTTLTGTLPVVIDANGQLGTGTVVIPFSPTAKKSDGLSRAIARYEETNAKLKTELAKQGRKVQELEAAVADQRKTFEKELADQRRAFEKDLQEQKSQIEAVSKRLELVAPLEVSSHK
jgi:uncharacterized coiled-coil protein SlyX